MQTAAGRFEQGDLAGAARRRHPPAAAYATRRFKRSWLVQFRRRGGRLGLGEEAGDHAPKTGGNPSAELAGHRGHEQLLVGERQEQFEPAVVIPLDGDRQFAEVGVPWVFEASRQRGRAGGADNQVLSGEKPAEIARG